MKSILAITILALLSGVFMLAGCGDDDDPVKPPDQPAITCAETPDTLMDIFEEIYSAREFDTYVEILSEDFLFVTDNQADTYGYEVELEITQKMFTGQAGVDGIRFRDISIDKLEPQGIWQSTGSEDEFFGDFPESQYRDYDMDISFYVQGQNMRLRVQGLARFYVLQDSVNGQTCYKFLGMQDNTRGWKKLDLKAIDPEKFSVEDHSWSDIKALFL